MVGMDEAETTPRGFQMVLDHLEQGMIDGTYAAGTQLPTERELASTLGTSRGAVREAIRALQAQGLVTTDTGPRNGSRVSTGQGEAVGRILRLHLALGASSMDDLNETRVALERSTAQLAATRADEAARTELVDLCRQMELAPNVEAFNDLDTLFHIAIARASGNRLAADLTVAIRYAARAPILDAEQTLDDWPAFRAILMTQHTDVLDAILDGRGEDAAHAMDSHIRSAYTGLAPVD